MGKKDKRHTGVKEKILKNINFVREQIKEIEKIGIKNFSSRKSKEHIFDNKINEIFYSVDVEGVVNYISPAIEDYGFQSEDIISSKFTKYIVPADKEKIISEFQRTILTGEEFISRFRLKNDNGDVYWFEDNGKVQRNKFGMITGIKGVLKDITEHIQIKNRLEEKCSSFEKLIRENSDRIVQVENKIVKIKREEAVILDNMQEHVVYQDLDNKILWANKSAADSLELSADELKGRYCYNLWHKRKTPCPKCPVIKTRETGQVQESKIVSPDGKVWRIKGTPVKDKDGKVKGIIELTLDVTDKERTKLDLKRKEKIIDSSVNAVVLSDLEGKLLYVNSSFLEMWGVDKTDEVIGKPASYFWKFREKALKVIQSVKKKGLWVGELVAKRKDGSFFDARVLANLIKDKQGNPLYLSSSFIDITKQKEMEKILKESESRFKVVTERALTGVYLIKDHKFEYINPKLAEIFGYKKEEIINKLGPLDLTHPDDREIVKENIAKRIEKKQKEARYTFRGLCKDESIIICEVLGRLIEINGESAIMGHLIDITEKIESKKELESLNKELEEANNRLEEIALRDIHTGLYNYRYLKQSIEAEFQRAKRYDIPLSVIILDIDYFKSINDIYGHQLGDLVLRQLVDQLRKIVRQYDIIARFGGNTFVILSPGSNRAKSLSLANRILDTVNLYNFGDEKRKLKLGLSISIASWPEDKVFRSMELIDIADRILERAKEDGGNNIYTSDDIHNGRIIVSDKKDDIKFLKSKIKKINKESNQSLMESVFAFAKTIKLKDNYTGDHVENTVTYALKIGRALGLSSAELENIRQSAILHDLGKLGISDSILNKKTELTEEEFKEIKKHPQIGVDIIRPLRFLHAIIPFILYHHEHYDGKGYPKGLKGEDIPIGARIIAIADVYQALVSNRSYRKAYSPEKAKNIIKKASGTQFDSQIVDLFLRILS